MLSRFHTRASTSLAAMAARPATKRFYAAAAAGEQEVRIYI